MKCLLFLSCIGIAATTHCMEMPHILGKKAHQLAKRPIHEIEFIGLEGESKLYVGGHKEEIRESLCSILSAVRVNDTYADRNKTPVVVDFSKIKLIPLPPSATHNTAQAKNIQPPTMLQKVLASSSLIGLGIVIGYLLAKE